MIDILSQDNFEVYLSPPEGHAKLSHLHKISSRVQNTLNAVAQNLSSNEKAYVDAEIIGATIGSLDLALRPSVPDIFEITPQQVCSTFVNDLVNVPRQQFRPDMTPGLLHQYHSLSNCLKDAHIKVRIRYRDAEAMIDDAFRAGVDAATQEKEAGQVEIIGRIEAVNIHQHPYSFHIYPKQPGAERILCRFDNLLLHSVTESLSRKEIVKVVGIGYYSPVGIYPQRIQLSRAPEPIVFQLDVLKSAIRGFNLVPSGMNIVDYMEMKRKEAGLDD